MPHPQPIRTHPRSSLTNQGALCWSPLPPGVWRREGTSVWVVTPALDSVRGAFGFRHETEMSWEFWTKQLDQEVLVEDGESQKRWARFQEGRSADTAQTSFPAPAPCVSVCVCLWSYQTGQIWPHVLEESQTLLSECVLILYFLFQACLGSGSLFSWGHSFSHFAFFFFYLKSSVSVKLSSSFDHLWLKALLTFFCSHDWRAKSDLCCVFNGANLL